MHFAWLALALVPALASADDTDPKGGTKVASFTLRDFRGAESSLEQFAAKKAVVLAFVGCECPVAKLYGPRLATLAKAYEAQGVQFLGIDANQQDGVSQIARFARDSGIAFPILKDVNNVLADQLGVERTTEVVVLDGERTIRYRGRIDDQYNVGISRTTTTQNDLSAALDELLAGKPISKPATPAVGCFIGRVRKSPATGTVTFAKDVARILNTHCVECHRPGQIGPFSLTSYEDAIGWADTIDEVVRQGRMPPWHADPRYGHFANDSRLTALEKKTIADWVQAGTPEGDPKDAPPAPVFAEGWRIPKPDVVFTIPKPYKVKATGTIDYQFFVIDTGFTEDKWIQAAEVKPSCRAVVHHALIFAQPPSEPLVLNPDTMTPQKGVLNRGGGGARQGGNRPAGGPRGRGPTEGGFISKWLAAAVPGARPMWLPEGMAKRAPAGSRLVIQIHYTATGAPQEDQCSIGLVFADPKAVRKEVVTDMVANPRFEIPPRAPDFKVEAERVLEQDEEVLAWMPHTHVRGIGFKYEAIYPDGKKEVLLNVPRYDFNWQNTYVLTEPKLLPKGTTLRGEARYNNSASNLANPDPNHAVHWGEQTWEEMMIGYYDRTLVGEDRIEHPLPTPERPGTKAPPALDPDLARLAHAALDSQTAFDAFARAVHEKLPQIDRVCVTTMQDGSYVVQRSAYPGKKVDHFAETGFEAPARMVPMTRFALLNRLVSLPDLKALDSGPQLGMITAALKSSVHVPVSVDGLPSNVNFWSAQPNAFPEDSLAMLQSLAAKVVSKNSEATDEPPAKSQHQAIKRTDPNSLAAHEQLLAKAKQGRIDVYFEGDSITRRWGATDYPRFLAQWKRQFHGRNAANFGWGGDTTQNILWRLQNGELSGVSPKVIVLQAGTNNLPSTGSAGKAKVDEVVTGLKAIIGVFQQQAPQATIVLTGVFPRSQNMSLKETIDQINTQLSKLDDGKRIRFLNINDKIADTEGKLLAGMSSDGLHLEAKGYDVWAEALQPILTEIMGPPATEDHAPPPTGDPRKAQAPAKDVVSRPS